MSWFHPDTGFEEKNSKNIWKEWLGDPALAMVARESHFEELSFELRAKWQKTDCHAEIWGKGIWAEEYKYRCKGPEAKGPEDK